jgi:Asp-tRNA(Asn)/Glu-tRNA(Gln) amidotransferase A subunit family amidase
MAQSLPDLAIMLDTGEATAAELTQTYLDRIDAIDRNGPR